MIEEPPVYLTPTGAIEAEIEMTAQVKNKWECNDHVHCHHIMESLIDELFDQFSNKAKTARDFWEALRAIYFGEEANN